MHPDLRQILDDDEWHSRGGCHVFAVTLVIAFPEEAYSLKRLEYADPVCPSPSFCAVHVFAAKDDYAIDGHGIRPEAELISAFEARCRNNKLRSVPCTNPDLLLPDPKMRDAKGLKNKWRLDLDPEFVKEAVAKSLEILSQHPAKYKRSLRF